MESLGSVLGASAMKYGVSLLLALLLNAAANLLMKAGMRATQERGGILRDGVVGAVKTVVTSPVLLLGLICFAVNAAFYMYALQSKALKISIAYPIMVGGGFAVIALVARFHPAFMERLTWGQMGGIALVFAGITMITTQANADPG